MSEREIRKALERVRSELELSNRRGLLQRGPRAALLPFVFGAASLAAIACTAEPLLGEGGPVQADGGSGGSGGSMTSTGTQSGGTGGTTGAGGDGAACTNCVGGAGGVPPEGGAGGEAGGGAQGGAGGADGGAGGND